MAVRTADVLRFHPSKGARLLSKVIRSAVANAQENHGADPDSLRITDVQINEGPVIKRIQARAMGRANRIEKKLSHITVVVEDGERKKTIKPHGTKPKSRPSFSVPRGKGKKKDAPKAEEAVAVMETAALPDAQASEGPVAEEGSE